MRWRQRQFLSQTIENQARSQTYQVEMLSGMETLKAMGLEHQAAENWSNVFVDGLNISIKRGRLDAMLNGLLSLLGTASTLVMMFYGTYLVISGGWTLGTMTAFSAVAGGFLGPLNNLVASALQLQMLEVYLEPQRCHGYFCGTRQNVCRVSGTINGGCRTRERRISL